MRAIRQVSGLRFENHRFARCGGRRLRICKRLRLGNRLWRGCRNRRLWRRQRNNGWLRDRGRRRRVCRCGRRCGVCRCRCGVCRCRRRCRCGWRVGNRRVERGGGWHARHRRCWDGSLNLGPARWAGTHDSGQAGRDGQLDPAGRTEKGNRFARHALAGI